MRLIAGQTPGWKTTLVYLNGEKLENCFDADDEAGVALVHLTDIERMRSDNPRITSKFVTGKIEFRSIEQAQTDQLWHTVKATVDGAIDELERS